MIPCTCVDASKRPNEIPPNKWVEEGKKYHIIYVYWHPVQKVQGVDLAEVEMDETCKPYATYQLRRFAFKKEDIEQFIELCKACTEMGQEDIAEVVKELILEEEFA